MYFRYKVESSYEVFSFTEVENYTFNIEIYCPNKFRKWKNFDTVSLKSMLGHVYNLNSNFINLEKCLAIIKNNGGIENIMTKYIKMKLKENEDSCIEANKHNQIVAELNEMLISKKWKTIDVSVEE